MNLVLERSAADLGQWRKKELFCVQSWFFSGLQSSLAPLPAF